MRGTSPSRRSPCGGRGGGPPLGPRQASRPDTHGAALVDDPLVTSLAITVRAGVGGVGERGVDRRVRRVTQRSGAVGLVWVGKARPSPRNQSHTPRTEPRSAKRSSRSGSRPGRPRRDGGAPRRRARPTPSDGQPAPQLAAGRLVVDPPSRRARSTCSSASDIVPLSPRSSRSLKAPGWYKPSESPMSVSVTAHSSRSRYQSALLRARRLTSRPRMIPTRPRAISAARRANPLRSAVPEPERPRSSSMTTICSTPSRVPAPARRACTRRGRLAVAPELRRRLADVEIALRRRRAGPTVSGHSSGVASTGPRRRGASWPWPNQHVDHDRPLLGRERLPRSVVAGPECPVRGPAASRITSVAVLVDHRGAARVRGGAAAPRRRPGQRK